ncbi:MAG TPA: acetate--CoA ligase family protein [Steroidobacteraceae bacterium]
MRPPCIKRLLAPRTIALFGGAWADAVEAASRAIGYSGEIWRVHPQRASTHAVTYFRSVAELPQAPDAAFLAAPAGEIPALAAALAARDAGGFVCFAAGFSETGTQAGAHLTQELIRSAAAVPYFGPNCYGFLNFFDRVALWPDQVVGGVLERGVALICQSGTLALNLLFNRRSLPIGYVLTVGNQTCLAIEQLIELLCTDERVTAFGLYVEGLQDTNRFAAAVAGARAAGKPIALVKAGRTESAARTARTHTGALAGTDTVFDAFCRQAGIARCDSLATLCETLKVLHMGGPLRGRRILAMGASGGDMAMAADASRHLGLSFPDFPCASSERLHTLLTDKVTVSNPFDFHTHIWFDRAALHTLFCIAQRSGFDATALMIDAPSAPQADPASYLAVIEEYIAAFPSAPARAAVVSSLPESMLPATAAVCLAAGIVPLQGQREALEALDLAGQMGETWAADPGVELRAAGRVPPAGVPIRSLAEHVGKAALSAFGVRIPRACVVACAEAAEAAQRIGFPLVMKAVGEHLEHKSDVGAVVLNIRTTAEAQAAARRLSALSEQVLVEEMIVDGIAEVLIGMSVDPQFGQVLVLGAGGVLAELLQDAVCLLPPFTPGLVRAALGRLKIAKLLNGFRGRPPGDLEALVASVLACTRYAQVHAASLLELDINPVIVRPAGCGAVAVDVLIRLLEEH